MDVQCPIATALLIAKMTFSIESHWHFCKIDCMFIGLFLDFVFSFIDLYIYTLIIPQFEEHCYINIESSNP